MFLFHNGSSRFFSKKENKYILSNFNYKGRSNNENINILTLLLRLMVVYFKQKCEWRLIRHGLLFHIWISIKNNVVRVMSKAVWFFLNIFINCRMWYEQEKTPRHANILFAYHQYYAHERPIPQVQCLPDNEFQQNIVSRWGISCNND